jgi:hypothetical protein
MAETRVWDKRGSHCRECVKITGAEYHKKHKERQAKLARRHYEANREKIIARTRSYALADPEKRRLYAKKWHQDNIERRKKYYLKNILKKQYGLTVEQYEAMLKEQHGLCAICQKPPKKRRLDVDHDHADGHVRQLLCERCNKGMGCFEDSPQLLEAALRYLRKHSQLRLVG